jgi:hypothetical protein
MNHEKEFLKQRTFLLTHDPFHASLKLAQSIAPVHSPRTTFPSGACTSKIASLTFLLLNLSCKTFIDLSAFFFLERLMKRGIQKVPL